MADQIIKQTNFSLALGMLIQPNPLPSDWDDYYKAAKELGMSRQHAQEFLEDYMNNQAITPTMSATSF